MATKKSKVNADMTQLQAKTDLNKQKQQAAEHAVQSIESGMVLGLGTGSTVNFALEALAQRLRDGDLRNIKGVPSSTDTESLARELGIPLTSFDEVNVIDLGFDGADEVDGSLRLIKGGGGALLREKVLAQASQRNLIIVDESKQSARLGSRWALPVEVLPFCWKLEAGYIQSLGAEVLLRRDSTGSPRLTDEGNVILDCNFGPIDDPESLDARLNQRAGIVEHGLFIGLASEVIIAGKEGIQVLRPQSITES